MQGSTDATTRGARRALAAAIAAVLSVALSFMAFDANALRQAFAQESLAEQSAELPGTSPEPGDDDPQDDAATVFAGGGNPEGAEGEPVEQDGEGQVQDGPQNASARDGPDEDVPGEDELEDTKDSEDAESSLEQTAADQDDSRQRFASDGSAAFEEDACDETSEDALVTSVVTFYSDDASSGPRILSRKAATAAPGQLAVVSVVDVVASLLGESDVELYARWTGMQSQYRVATWYENADDDRYAYQSHYTVGGEGGEPALAGTMTDVADAPDVPGFQLQPIQRKVIAGDGSTVVNLYYDRIDYEIMFHQDNDDDAPLFEELTITAKYGQDVHDRWPKATEGDGAYDLKGLAPSGYVEGETRYTATSGETFVFRGWYDNVLLEGEPFDLSQPITEDTSLVALWRSAGSFDIAYDPTVEVEGDVVRGTVDTMLDEGYADLSPTYVLNTPQDISSDSGAAYAFAGWRVVESFDAGAAVLSPELYREGDGFVVDSDLATNNTIHLQAVYQADPSPDVGPVPDSNTDLDSGQEQEPGSAVPSDSAADGGAGTGADDAGATVAIPLADTSSAGAANAAALPGLGDFARTLALAMGGIALLALGAALFGRLLRKGIASIYIDRDPEGQ